MSLATTPTPDPAGSKAAADAPPLENLLKGNRNATSAAVLPVIPSTPGVRENSSIRRARSRGQNPLSHFAQ